MKRSMLAAALLGAASLVFAGSVQAQVKVPKEQEFPATPIQKGAPEDLPGENLVPGAKLAVHTLNTVTQPILQPLLAPEGEAPAAAPPMKKKMMMKHHMMKHHMSKKMMMKKKMMMMKKKM